jgi:hypothetical protein
MKKLIYLLSVTFLMLQSCSSGDSSSGGNINSNDNTFLMRKWYDNSYQCPSNGNRDYYEFSKPNIFKHYVTPSSSDCNYILPETGTWTRNGVTIIIDYDQAIGNSILTIDELSATTFSFVSDGGWGVRYNVLTSY